MDEPVTPAELLAQFQAIAQLNAGDPEYTHSEMDEMMVRALRSLGYAEAMDVYESTTRWHA